jgi:ribonuclease Z
MELHFLGVGEACDSREPNTSILIKTKKNKSGSHILLDCGFTVPHRYFALTPNPEKLKILWISHFHGDHFLGTPLLLLWFWEIGRRQKLSIAGPPEVEKKITTAMELAYPNLIPRLGFPLQFIEVDQGPPKTIADSIWRTAYNDHSQPCLSLRLELEGKAIFYSGDGRPTTASKTLARGCDVIIHEAYGFDDSTPGHGSIGTCVEFASQAEAKKIALLHLQRDLRPKAGAVIENYKKKYPALDIMLPDTGTIINL